MSEYTIADATTGGNDIDFNTVPNLCQEPHRRIALGLLAPEKRPLTVQDLTKGIVKHNHPTPLIEVSEEVITNIQISLHHAHLPRLEAAGIIEYELERQVVEPTKQFDQLQPWLSAIIDADPALELPVEL